MADKVNLAEKLGSFSDHWAPRIVARYNDNEVRLVKVEGEFIWHSHEETDELFLILEGQLESSSRDRTIELQPGECSSSRAERSTARAPPWRGEDALIGPQDLPNTANRDGHQGRRNLGERHVPSSVLWGAATARSKQSMTRRSERWLKPARTSKSDWW